MRANRLAAQVLVSTALVIPVVTLSAPIATAAPQANAVSPANVVDTGSAGSSTGSSTGSSSGAMTLACQFSSAILQLMFPTQSVPKCVVP